MTCDPAVAVAFAGHCVEEVAVDGQSVLAVAVEVVPA